MKTQEILKDKAKFNWFYLMLAIILFYASLNITATTRFWMLNQDQLNSMKFWLFVAGLCYSINWIYGVFYFPMKYFNILRNSYVSNYELTDLSFLRGSLAAIITVYAFLMYITNIHFEYQVWLYVLIALWLIVHLVLAMACRTDKLFSSNSVMIDEVVLMPWLERGDGADNRYMDIYFSLPTEEDEEAWIRRVIIAYVSQKRHWYMSQTEAQRKIDLEHNEKFFEAQRQAEQEATELSAKIYEEIK